MNINWSALRGDLIQYFRQHSAVSFKSDLPVQAPFNDTSFCSPGIRNFLMPVLAAASHPSPTPRRIKRCSLCCVPGSLPGLTLRQVILNLQSTDDSCVLCTTGTQAQQSPLTLVLISVPKEPKNTQEVKTLSSLSSRASGRSYSRMIPRFITITRSAFRMVCTRCAIVTTVRSAKAVITTFCRMLSCGGRGRGG